MTDEKNATPETVFFRGVPLEFLPPWESHEAYCIGGRKTVFAVKQSVIDCANRISDGWQFVEVSRSCGVPVYELQKVNNE